MKNLHSIGLLILSALLLPACSGLKPYPDLPNKNVHLQSKLTAAGVMSGITADMSIHSVNEKCETTYLGTVDLDKANKDIGIVPGQLTYLYVVFSTSGLLGSSTGSTSYSTLFRPKAGYEYRIDLRYKDEIYNVELFELGAGKKSARELERRSFDDCKKM